MNNSRGKLKWFYSSAQGRTEAFDLCSVVCSQTTFVSLIKIRLTLFHSAKRKPLKTSVCVNETRARFVDWSTEKDCRLLSSPSHSLDLETTSALLRDSSFRSPLEMSEEIGRCHIETVALVVVVVSWYAEEWIVGPEVRTDISLLEFSQMTEMDWFRGVEQREDSFNWKSFIAWRIHSSSTSHTHEELFFF